MVEEKELCEWKTRYSHNQNNNNKKEKRLVEPGKEEEDKLEIFFNHIYECHTSVQIVLPLVLIPYDIISASASSNPASASTFVPIFHVNPPPSYIDTT